MKNKNTDKLAEAPKEAEKVRDYYSELYDISQSMRLFGMAVCGICPSDDQADGEDWTMLKGGRALREQAEKVNEGAMYLQELESDQDRAIRALDCVAGEFHTTRDQLLKLAYDSNGRELAAFVRTIEDNVRIRL